MVFVHRFIGQWLDENKSANQEETLSKALKKVVVLMNILKR